jgi:starch synthase
VKKKAISECFCIQFRCDWIADSGLRTQGARADLSYFYNAAEFLVCPSINEAFGLVNLEAMASGIPVIGTNVGIIKDIIVDGETGFLVQPKDSKALFEKMMVLLKDDTLSEFMAKA